MFGQLPYTEDFEGGSGGFTTSIVQSTDNSEDYFILTDGSNIAGTFGNVTGSYFAAQDIDAAPNPGAGAVATLTFSNIDITGCSALAFAIDIAEDDDGSNEDWDAGDYLHIDYTIDGGGVQNLIWVEGLGGFNTAPFIDTDFDGTGDGTEITSTFQNFSNSIAGTGNSLTITITIALESGDEDIAFDNISITGNCAACPGLDTEPTNEATGESVSNISCTTADISWTNGADATNSLVVISTAAISGTPTDGTAYSSNAVFGSGSTISAGEYVIYNGTGNSVSVSGLAEGTNYFVTIFGYNGATANCEENYLTGGVSTSFTTLTGCVSTAPYISSINYNACSASEGIDEIVTVITGSDPIDIDDITISYPSGGDYCNSGCGSQTNLNNPTYVSDLNTMAGCTVFAYANPIPPNSSVMIFTGNPPSTVLDYSSQCGAANLPVYVIFSNNSSTSGRFANSAERDLTIDWGTGSTQTVTYDGGLQGGDGATAQFNSDGSISSYFQSTDCVYPLPIELLYLKGENNDNYTTIKWATATERNNDYFVVEKSTDGINFSAIGTVNGNGNSSQQIDYSFIDNSPTALSYYRLKQMNFDGEFQYSYMIKVMNSNSQVYYSNNEIHFDLSTNANQNYTVNIYSLNGQLVHTSTTIDANIINWTKKGLYIIEIPELDLRQKLSCH